MFFWSTWDSICHIGLPSVRVRVQMCKCWCVPDLAVVLQVFTLSGSAVWTVVYSYSPCVVYCGPEPTLGPISLQICLPKKLLWWNVRQGEGRWEQTVKLFSLSLCFTPLTNFQDLHLAVIASKKEEFNQSVFMHLCVLLAYLITDTVLCLEICWIDICVRTLESLQIWEWINLSKIRVCQELIVLQPQNVENISRYFFKLWGAEWGTGKFKWVFLEEGGVI